MWILKYLACLIYIHSFIDVTLLGLAYRYCLHCGKVELQDMVKEVILCETIMADSEFILINPSLRSYNKKEGIQ